MPHVKPSDYLAGIQKRIAAVLPAGKDADVFLAITTEYLTRHPDLFQCEKHSLDDAIINAAMLGFELGKPFDLATILPYKNHKKGLILANLVIEYRGFMMQAYASGKVKAIEGRAVYDSDKFEFNYGKNPVLKHIPSILPARGAIVYAYAIAQLRDGGTAAEVITRHDADKARADSPGSGRPDSLWRTREPEMWIKTAIKKLANRLPRARLPAAGQSGPGPPAPEEYADLINAVLIAPDLYEQVIEQSPFAFPSDSGSIQTVLGMMRDHYRAEMTKDQAAQ